MSAWPRSMPIGAESQVVAPGAFAWTDHQWRGIEPNRHVVYALHVGTFTRAGTWLAARKQLAFLAQLGVTTVELTPTAEYEGGHTSRDDGDDLFTRDHAYGSPDDLRKFVDHAHALGLAVILDVVYDQLASSSEPSARERCIANAVSWIREFHFDGLRLDVTLADDEPTIVPEMIAAAREAAPDRTLWMVGEPAARDSKLLLGEGFDARWNDEYHRTARGAATRVEGDLRAGTARAFVAGLRQGFLDHGAARARFVHFLENHDQVAIGSGERLNDLAHPATLRALTALTLLTPSVPMLFQGQETGSKRPWESYSSRTGEQGAPAPNARACILDPRERDFSRPIVALHRDLLHLRQEDPAYTATWSDAFDAATLAEDAFVVRCSGDQPGGDRLILVNLGDSLVRAVSDEPLLAPPTGTRWKMCWSSEDVRYGGRGTPTPFTHEQLALPGHATVVCYPDAASAFPAVARP